VRPDPRDIDPGLPKALRRLYREVPSPECKGLCWECCNTVPAQQVELENLERVAGGPGNLAAPAGQCQFLSADRRCTAYAARPLICRLFGAVRHMPCPFGCKPAGGYLAPRKEAELLRRLIEIDPRLTGLDPALRGLIRQAELEEECEDPYSSATPLPPTRAAGWPARRRRQQS
jgi:uncharacterized protein